MSSTVTIEYECDECGRKIYDSERGLNPFMELRKVQSTPESGWFWLNSRLYCNQHEIVLKMDSAEKVIKPKVPDNV